MADKRGKNSRKPRKLSKVETRNRIQTVSRNILLPYARFRNSGKNPMRFAVFGVFLCGFAVFGPPLRPPLITVFAPFRWAFVKRSWLFCSPSFSSLFFISRCRSEEFNPGFTCISIQGIDSAKVLARKSTKLQEASLLKSWPWKSWPVCQHRFDEAIVPVIHCRQIKHTTILCSWHSCQCYETEAPQTSMCSLCKLHPLHSAYYWRVIWFLN